MTTSVPFMSLLSNIVDNRGRTCPTADSGLPLIATNCVKNSTLYPVFEKIRYVDQQTYSTWFRGHPLPGDLIFVCKGSPGQVCMAPDPVNFCIAQDMVAVRADPRKVYPPYLFAALRSDEVQSAIVNMHVGTLIPHFKKGDFDKLKIPLPDKPTQRFIGDMYLSLTEKIELNRRINETLEGMAQTIFRDWFVDFGPVHKKAAGESDPVAIMGDVTANPDRAAQLAGLFPDALGDDGLPVGWRLSRVGDWMDILDSKRIPLSSRQREERKGSIPYHGATSVMGHVDTHLFDEVLLLIGEDGSVVRPDGKPFTQYVWGKIWVNNHAHVLRGKGITTEHLKCFFETVDIAPFVTGAVQPKLNQANMKAVPFVAAVDAVNKEFGTLIEPIFARIRVTVEETNILAETRDFLLPRLMSGAVRLAQHVEAT
ncbi:restriction endonuclease subunit S [Bradyrhizobium sp. B039]|uniref:restriction endonuclease subunit S n=1 Tax=Bradyrhizobium sp. B039 TaxID=3140239 RepID=UPI00318449EC